LSPADSFTARNYDAASVAIERLQPTTMVDQRIVPVDDIFAGFANDSRAGRADVRVTGHGNVEARVSYTSSRLCARHKTR
jgi:hypothetical protein